MAAESTPMAVITAAQSCIGQTLCNERQDVPFYLTLCEKGAFGGENLTCREAAMAAESAPIADITAAQSCSGHMTWTCAAMSDRASLSTIALYHTFFWNRNIGVPNAYL